MDRYLVTQQSRYFNGPVLLGVALVDPALERSRVWQWLVERQLFEAVKRPPESQPVSRGPLLGQVDP